MKSLRPSFFLLACIASCVHAGTPDPSLIGCWRAAKIVLYAQNGSKIEDTSGRCALQFKEDQLESACLTTRGMARVTYQYRVVRPNFYVTTMTASTFKTDLVGATREYEYHVDGDRLVTVTKPPATADGGPAAAVRVTSESARTPCP
jgi:hypothetical protein